MSSVDQVKAKRWQRIALHDRFELMDGMLFTRFYESQSLRIVDCDDDDDEVWYFGCLRTLVASRPALLESIKLERYFLDYRDPATLGCLRHLLELNGGTSDGWREHYKSEWAGIAYSLEKIWEIR